MKQPLLAVEGLRVEYLNRGRLFSAKTALKAVNSVSFAIKSGQTFGLVGESGSGKSTVVRTILQLVEPAAGTIRLDNVDVTHLAKRDQLGFRKRVQAVLQDPYSSLNQAHCVETIIGDGISRHFGLKAGHERRQRTVDVLEAVGLSASHLGRYPRQLSGGQRQRVSIARALAIEPDLIIADEVTSSLDVSVQSQVINLLKDLQRDNGVALLFVGHDLEVVRYMSDIVGVMYLGYLVESGDAASLYESPTHPYTEMLLNSIPVPNPQIQASRKLFRRSFASLSPPPNPSVLPAGCPFESRCPVAMDICRQELPEVTTTFHGGTSRCHLHTSGPELAGASVVDFIRNPLKE